MSIFKNLFKRKKGGTLVGNVFRNVAFEATGGLLGSGKDLNAWEVKQGYDPTNIHVKPPKYQEDVINDFAMPLGNELKQKINNDPTVKEAKKQLAMNWLKNNWKKLLIPVALVAGIIWYIKKNKRTR